MAYVNIYDVLAQGKRFVGERFEDMVHMTIALEIHFTLEHNEISIKDLRYIVGSHNFYLNLSEKRENSYHFDVMWNFSCVAWYLQSPN